MALLWSTDEDTGNIQTGNKGSGTLVNSSTCPVAGQSICLYRVTARQIETNAKQQSGLQATHNLSFLRHIDVNSNVQSSAWGSWR